MNELVDTLTGTGSKQMCTYITLVLDRSGSMGCIRDEAVSAFNEQLEMIKDNAEKGGKTSVRVIQFASNVEAGIFVPAAEVEPLTRDTYIPGGMTALNDAIAKGIGGVPTLRPDRKDAALLIVVSDGHENASSIGTATIRDRIIELEKSESWTFSFFLANQDIRKAANDYGFNPKMARTFTADCAGMSAQAVSSRSMQDTYFTARSHGGTKINNFPDSDADAE